jgi:hypothetical protein
MKTIALAVGLSLLLGSGNPVPPTRVVANALDWLADHQHPSGYWDCDGFGSLTGVGTHGPGGAAHDPGVTGLALLAFLGAEQTHRSGPYRDTVRRGLAWLRSIQDREGCFGPRTRKTFVYNHALATQAMAEAYGLTGTPPFGKSAQAGVRFIEKCRNPYLAWRYGVRPQDNDTSVTAWMVAALWSAKSAGLDVPEDAFEGAASWIEKVTEPEYGRVGYASRGTGPTRPERLLDRFPSDKSESLTAAGIVVRIWCGEDPAKSEMIGRGVDLCLECLPVWDEDSGSIDMHYWYWGTLAFAKIGAEADRDWREAVRLTLSHQRKDGRQRGSWDPVGAWGREGGRVYSTALMTLIAEEVFQGELRGSR